MIENVNLILQDCRNGLLEIFGNKNRPPQSGGALSPGDAEVSSPQRGGALKPKTSKQIILYDISQFEGGAGIRTKRFQKTLGADIVF
jgi:hypothetical protein